MTGFVNALWSKFVVFNLSVKSPRSDLSCTDLNCSIILQSILLLDFEVDLLNELVGFEICPGCANKTLDIFL